MLGAALSVASMMGVMWRDLQPPLCRCEKGRFWPRVPATCEAGGGGAGNVPDLAMRPTMFLFKQKIWMHSANM